MEKVEDVIFLSGLGNHDLGKEILVELSELSGFKCEFNHITFNKFFEGELDNRISNYKKLKGKTIVFYQSIFSQELLVEALDLICACKHQYGAHYVIGVFPFLWNRRQDPKMENEIKEGWSKKIAKPDEIQRLRQTIFFLKCAGLDEMMVVTPHSNSMEEYCKEYGVKFHGIDPSNLFKEKIDTYISIENQKQIRIYAPDEGSIPRAINLARIIDCPVLFNLKNRTKENNIHIVEEEIEQMEKMVRELRKYYKFEETYYITPDLIKEKIIIMVEDEVCTGETANTIGCMLKNQEVKSLFFFATHPVLTLSWRNKLFKDDPFDKVIMTNTIPRGYEKSTNRKIVDIKLHLLIASSLFQVLNHL